MKGTLEHEALRLTCLRCSHQWIRRTEGKLPVACPSCKSPVWNKPRRDKAK